MKSIFQTTALIAALAPAVAAADSITLNAPLQGATLQSGQVDMSVYFLTLPDGAYEVVATYVTDANPSDPQRLVMALKDGDAPRFGLPGQSGTLYAFERKGLDVIVRSAPVDEAATATETLRM